MQSGRQVLTDLSYTLDAGEYVAIMGESGVGKSTLLNLIAGFGKPGRAGEVLIDGMPFHHRTDDAATRLQRKEYRLSLSAHVYTCHIDAQLQNIALPLLLNGISGERIDERTEQMLVAAGLNGRGQHFPASDVRRRVATRCHCPGVGPSS